jgi:hypothetical protein
MAHTYSNIENVYAAKVRIGVTLLSALIRTVSGCGRLQGGRSRPQRTRFEDGGGGHRVARFSKWSTFE